MICLRHLSPMLPHVLSPENKCLNSLISCVLCFKPPESTMTVQLCAFLSHVQSLQTSPFLIFTFALHLLAHSSQLFTLRINWLPIWPIVHNWSPWLGHCSWGPRGKEESNPQFLYPDIAAGSSWNLDGRSLVKVWHCKARVPEVLSCHVQ